MYKDSSWSQYIYQTFLTYNAILVSIAYLDKFQFQILGHLMSLTDSEYVADNIN